MARLSVTINCHAGNEHDYECVCSEIVDCVKCMEDGKCIWKTSKQVCKAAPPGATEEGDRNRALLGAPSSSNFMTCCRLKLS